VNHIGLRHFNPAEEEKKRKSTETENKKYEKEKIMETQKQ
jgi:hypothetical protein